MTNTIDTASLMNLSVEQRREYFRKFYTIELGRLHATGACNWPIERLPEIAAKAMAAALSKSLPTGPAMEATRKIFKLKTNKAVFEFLGL